MILLVGIFEKNKNVSINNHGITLLLYLYSPLFPCLFLLFKLYNNIDH